MTDVVKRQLHEIDRLAVSRRVRIEAVECWVGECLPNLSSVRSRPSEAVYGSALAA